MHEPAETSVAVQSLISSSEIDIPSAIYTGSIADLYAFIASEVAAFAAARGFALAEPPSGSKASLPEASAEEDSQPSQAPLAAPAAAAAAAGASGAADSASSSQTACAAEGPAAGDTAESACAPEGPAAGDAAESAAQAAAPSTAAAPPAPAAGSAAAQGSSAAGGCGTAAAPVATGNVATGGGAAVAACPPLGFCFSFPMKQSGLTTCAPTPPLPRPRSQRDTPACRACDIENLVVRSLLVTLWPHACTHACFCRPLMCAPVSQAF